MADFWLYMLLVTTLCVAQSMEPINSCTGQSTPPACILSFTPWMIQDIEPKTTMYEAFVVKYLNIIDCKYCSVVNIEDNPTPTGHFTERVTSPVLVVTKVACMPESTAITRRDIRGYSETTAIEARTALPNDPIEHIVSEQGVKDELAADPAPGTWDIMQAITEYRKQIYSAFMAVTLILSGLDRQWMCDGLGDSALQLSLAQQNLYPNQIGNLVCYSAKFGIQFNASTFQVLDQLSSTATSLLLAAQNNLTESALTIDLCQDLTLDKSLYTMLQIDNKGIYKVACTGVTNDDSTFTSSSTVFATVSAAAGASSSAVTFTSFGSNGTVLVTGTAVDISWSAQGGTGAVSATLTDSIWSFGAGNASATAMSTGGVSFGTAASASWSVGSGSTASFANKTAISASWSGANATASAGTSFPFSSSAVGVSSVSIGANATFHAGSTGSIASGLSSHADNATLVPTATGSAASWSFGASGIASFGVTATGGSPPMSGVTGGTQAPSWSWTTFTNANGSVIVSGTAAATGVWSWGLSNSTSIATATGGVVGTAAGTAATATWTSLAGNATIVYSYSGMAWTSWIVSSQATVAVITGTAGSIDWGSAEVTALITGAGQAVTFTIYETTKIIIVTATAIGQTWSAYGASSDGVITASGTAGTWTLESQTSFGFNASASGTGAASTWTNASASTSLIGSGSLPASVNATLTATGSAAASVFGTVLSSIGGNNTVPVISSPGRPMPPGSVNSSVSSLSNGSGIPFVPADLTATIETGNISSTVSASGSVSLVTSAVGSALTSWSGNSTAVINATTIIGTAISNMSTTVVGTIAWSSIASVGTGLVTITNPVNGSNVTLSLSSPLLTPPKSFSYPGWTTSTTPAVMPNEP